MAFTFKSLSRLHQCKFHWVNHLSLLQKKQKKGPCGTLVIYKFIAALAFGAQLFILQLYVLFEVQQDTSFVFMLRKEAEGERRISLAFPLPCPWPHTCSPEQPTIIFAVYFSKLRCLFPYSACLMDR